MLNKPNNLPFTHLATTKLSSSNNFTFIRQIQISLFNKTLIKSIGRIDDGDFLNRHR